jgi:aminopeptidase
MTAADQASQAAMAQALAELVVSDVGVNVQSDQIVGITAEPGMEQIYRAVGEAAYRRGARYVDLWLFDPHLKHSRLRHAPMETLEYRPPWWGDRYRALGDLAGANIRLSGQAAPGLMDDIAPERLGLDMMPRLPEALEVTHAGLWNWIVTPGACPGWAGGLFPELAPAAAQSRLWAELSRVLRLDTPNPATAWRERLATLAAVAAHLNGLKLESLHFQGPGTDLRVGLLAGSLWKAAADTTASGVSFTPNLPTEEVYTAPDPRHVDGYVSSTKPLVVGGGVVEGLSIRFEAGRAVEVDARAGAGLVRTMVSRDEGAARLGEVALVDADSRVGQLGTVFFDTLLDENSASHLALGAAYPDTVSDQASRAQINRSAIHIDFMIGSAQVTVTGVCADQTRVPLLSGGRWQFSAG